MKTLFVMVLLMALVPLLALGRMFQIYQPATLFADSKLVFIGRVKSVKPSGITTTLSYPTWEGVTFEWLTAELEVMENLKGAQKGDLVRTAMLSVKKIPNDDPGMLSDEPGMLTPEKGDIFLLCLLPTPSTNVFAALSAPWDEYLSVLPLHRSRPPTKTENPRDPGKDILPMLDKKFDLLLRLVDQNGAVVPSTLKRVREAYGVELAKEAPARLIYLEWEKRVNASGWQIDVPKGWQSNAPPEGQRQSPITFTPK